MFSKNVLGKLELQPKLSEQKRMVLHKVNISLKEKAQTDPYHHQAFVAVQLKGIHHF